MWPTTGANRSHCWGSTLADRRPRRSLKASLAARELSLLRWLALVSSQAEPLPAGPLQNAN
jgi:hypothetical protein